MFVISVITGGSGGMGELVSLQFLCLNPDLEDSPQLYQDLNVGSGVKTSIAQNS